MSDQLGFNFNAPDDEASIELKRDDLRNRVASFDLDTVEQKVAWVLNQFPEARDSDPVLLSHYYRTFFNELADSGVIRLTDLPKVTPLWSIGRARRKIQNTYGMYRASPEVQKHRGVLKDELLEKHAGAHPTHPALNVYADESGKTQDYLVVGGIWFVAPENISVFWREFDSWTKENLSSSELHFKKISSTNIETYKSFVSRFVVMNPLFGFKFLAVSNKGLSSKESALADMFYHFLSQGVLSEHTSGRAELPRSINFVKDADSEGADQIMIANLKDRMANFSGSRLDGTLSLGTMTAEDSKTSPFLQVADLYASSIGRHLNVGGSGPKDEFASFFLDATGGLPTESALIGDRSTYLSV